MTTKTIEQYCKDAHQASTEKGFYEKPFSLPRQLALLHSEITEALEADREDSFVKSGAVKQVAQIVVDEQFYAEFEDKVKDTFEDELADTFIRLADLAHEMGVDLEAHIQAKMRYNALRPYKNGGKKY